MKMIFDDMKLCERAYCVECGHKGVYCRENPDGIITVQCPECECAVHVDYI